MCPYPIVTALNRIVRYQGIRSTGRTAGRSVKINTKPCVMVRATLRLFNDVWTDLDIRTVAHPNPLTAKVLNRAASYRYFRWTSDLNPILTAQLNRTVLNHQPVLLGLRNNRNEHPFLRILHPHMIQKTSIHCHTRIRKSQPYPIPWWRRLIVRRKNNLITCCPHSRHDPVHLKMVSLCELHFTTRFDRQRVMLRDIDMPNNIILLGSPQC